MKKTKNISRIKDSFTKQHSQYYCGLACLSSIVKFHGGEITQEKLREESGTNLYGTSLLGLYQAAQKLGFESKGYEGDIESLKEINTPVILHIMKDGSIEHYVIFYGYKRGKFIIGDPSWGIIEFLEEELDAVWKSKAMLFLEPGKNFTKIEVQNKNKQNWFKELIQEDIPVLLVAAFMGAVLSVLGLAVAIYIQKLIDNILPSGDKLLLFRSLGVFIFILFAKAFVGYLRGTFLVRQSKDMNIRIVSLFFRKLLFLPKSFFDSISSGDMIGRLNDSQRIQRVVINLTSNILIDALIAISSIGYIFFQSVTTGLISTLSIPIFAMLAFAYNRKVIESQREVMQTYAKTQSKYIEAIQGIQVVKSGNKESLMSKTVQLVYNTFQNKVYKLGLLGNKINFWAQIGSVILFSGIIIWCSLLVINNHILLGQMMAIITIVGTLVSSVINISMANIQFQEAKVAFERIFEFSAAKPEYNPEEFSQSKIVNVKSLEIKDLNFRFPGKSLLLKGINMRFEKGQMTTVFGEIGCGKSTLITILQRFYRFESGQIFINDKIDWDILGNQDWRYHTAYVAQHVKLFNSTILENICMEENINPEKVMTFCKEIGLDLFINEFQQGYATIVNENSTNLSGGQQQLIALARALYQKPQILLLDEATAAMDRRTEQFVLKLLQKLKKEMIIIFVTHRVQLARHTDFIYVIENKQIAAMGRHDEVVQTSRLYREAFEEIVLVKDEAQV